MAPASRPLDGRIALVTGGGSGLGRAVAVSLTRAGADLVLVGRSRPKLEGVAAEIAERGGSPQVVVCDVSEPAGVAELAAGLRDTDISILVNNAGIGGPVADLVAIDPTDWDEVFAVNVRGTYLMCQAFLPAMIAARDGDIINLASVTGKRPLAGRTPYAASKMAVLGLTATLAAEVGQYGVRVNTLSPGPVRGERMTRNFVRESERSGVTVQQAEHEFVSRAAMARLVEQDEVGQAVVAMLQIPAMTGADLDLSAGMVAR